MVKYSDVAKSVFYLSIGQFITAFAQIIIVLPIYSQLLSPSEYASALLIVNSSSFLQIIFGFGLISSQFRYYALFQENKENLGKYMFSINSILAIIAFSILGIIYMTPLNNIAFRLLFPHEEISIHPNMEILIFLILISIFQSLVVNFLIAEGKTFIVGSIIIVSFVMKTFLILYFISILNLGYIGYIYGHFLSSLIILVPGYVYYATHFEIGWDKDLLKNSFKVGIPIMLSGLIGILLSTSSILIVQNFVSLGILGLFTLALRLGLFFSLFNEATIKSIKMGIFTLIRNVDQKNRKESVALLRNLFYLYYVLILSLCLISQLFLGEFVFLLINKSYFEVTLIIPILFTMFIGSSMMRFHQPFFVYYNRTSFVLYIRLAGLVLNIILLMILAPIYGLIGIAYIYVIVNGFTGLLTYILSTKYNINLEIEYKKLLLPLLLIFNPILFTIASNYGFLPMIAKIIYFGIFIIIIFLSFDDVLMNTRRKLISEFSLTRKIAHK